MIQIYTDGAITGNGTPDSIGGYGVIIINDRLTVFNGHVKGGTSNRMELIAAIEGLKACREKDYPVTLYSDSEYLVKTILCGWRRRKNHDLWSDIDEERGKFVELKWQHVRGHADNPYNNMCDTLAVIGKSGKYFSDEFSLVEGLGAVNIALKSL